MFTIRRQWKTLHTILQELLCLIYLVKSETFQKNAAWVSLHSTQKWTDNKLCKIKYYLVSSSCNSKHSSSSKRHSSTVIATNNFSMQHDTFFLWILLLTNSSIKCHKVYLKQSITYYPRLFFSRLLPVASRNMSEEISAWQGNSKVDRQRKWTREQENNK